MTTRTAMFILGAHRSGTSATTRLLNLLGVDLGRIPPDASEYNEKGFWEHPGVVAINEAVLADLGTPWDDSRPLPAEWWRRPTMEPHRDAIRRLVEAEFASTPLFGVKDPRLCRLVPLWLVSLQELPITPVFVLVLRHPFEIVASLGRQHGLPEHAGEAVWLTHMLEAERHTRRHRRVFVSYEELLADWGSQTRRIAKMMALSWPRSEAEVEAEVGMFLDPALRHFRADRSEWRPGLSRWVSEAYGLMAAAASGEESEEVRDGLARLQDGFSAAQAVFGPLLADEFAASAALQRQVAEQTAWARASAAQVAQRDTVLVELQRTLREYVQGARTGAGEIVRRDAIITELQASVSEQTQWAQASAAEVAKRDAIVAELQASLSEQTQWAQASAAEVAKRDAIITELQASLSEQTQWARANAAEVARGDALVEATRRDEDRLHRIEQAYGQQTIELKTRLDVLQRQMDELVAFSRRAIEEGLRDVHSGPRIHALHPGWTEAGQRFAVEGDGTAHLRVEGTGFGAEATVFVAGTPLVTSRVSGRLLSASVPDELFRRPGVLAVWVDNGTGARRGSAIHGFRVMSKRTVAAYRHASGRWRRVHDAINWLVWLTSGVASRVHILLFYLQRALTTTWTRAPAEPAAQPRIEALHPGWTEAGRGFNTQPDGHTALGVEGSAFGPEALLVVAGWPLETCRASDRLLTARVPDELFARSRVLSVWVDNRDGARRLSEIRCFRVMSKRTVAAYRPPSSRWKRLQGAFNWVVWLMAGALSRMHVPRFYLQRARGKRLRIPGMVLVTYPRRDALVPTREMVAAHIKPMARPRPPDIVCFSIIDWDFRYQRPQQILARLAGFGHRVFYLSQHFLGAEDEAFRLRPLVPGVTEVCLRSPSELNIYKDAIHGEAEDALYAALLELKAAVGLGETICLVHLPFWTPLVLRLKADLGYRVVFDCLDDFSGFQNIGNRMIDLERMLAAAADRVAVSSRMLVDKHAPHAPLLMPNAADYAHFSSATAEARRPEPPGLVPRWYEAIAHGCRVAARRLHPPAPVLGYYGAIAHWFDLDLIARAAAARPRWQFVLIGRTDPEVRAKLGGFPNVRLLAEKRYEDLPAHLAAFDICLIPFVVDDLIRATNPVKFFEYLSAGKPVVAARMPELLPFAGECFLYEGLGEFFEQVERALAEKDDPARIETRRAIAKANTWDMRVDVLRPALADLYPRASVIVVTYGGLELTQACVESLIEKTAYADWELIVVDNNSADGTPAYLRALSERYPFVRIVLNDTNRGFAAANNQGIRMATGEFIVLLNNDTVVTHGWLGRLLHHLDDRAVGMVGPVTNTVGNEAQIETDYHDDLVEMEAFADRYTRAHLGRVFDIPMLAMFCVAMRRSLVDTVGMLDERYEVGMFEDDDFARSVKALGYRVICAEDVFIHHVGLAAFRKLAPETYQRIFKANRKRYEEKWGEPWIPHRYRAKDEVGKPPGAP